MDVLAHGLWGGAGFLSRDRRTFAAAFVLGMAPDLLSFGLFYLTDPQWISRRFLGEDSGPPPISILPEFVFHAYNFTHSLVALSALSGLIWVLRRNPPWVFLAWGIHILCDIPTHSSAYFPTPFLWPLPTPFVDGISWATGWFIATNYAALLLTYIALLVYRRARRSGQTVPHANKSVW